MVSLDRACPIQQQGLHALAIFLQCGLDKAVQLQPGAAYAQYIGAIANDDIEPELIKIERRIVIDVETKIAGLRYRGEVPGIAG